VTQEQTIRILLADRHALFREAVKAALSSESDLQVIGDAEDGLEAVAQAELTAPHVAVVESSLVNLDGNQTAYLIAEQVPGCRVIVITDSEDQDALLEAVEAGADGFLTKSAPLSTLIDTIRSVSRGETIIPPHLLGGLLRRLIRQRVLQDGARRRINQLTRREKQVLVLLAEGASSEAIAEELVISPQTARTHIQNVLSKLGVHSRLEAAAFMTKHRILKELQEAVT
jgi:DNA-binding NarL/FixJ family response regulator